MQKLSESDLVQLSQSFLGAAHALSDFLFDEWDSLQPAVRARLNSMHTTLTMVSTDLITHAVGVSLDDTQTPLEQLISVTSDAKRALGKIKSSKNAIKVATTLIGLATAISTGDAPHILAAANGLAGQLEAADGKA
jgi:hypothetical protein